MDRKIKPNTVKEKIRKLEPIICAFMRIPDPSVAEIMALSGVELIVIDYEHYQFNPETLVNIIRAADIYGVSCLIRVTGVDHGQICRYLDMGAVGVFLADAENSEQIKKVVDAVKYYPAGHRGVSTDSRGSRFSSVTNIGHHTEFFNANTIIAVVIETKSAVDDLDQILAIPEIDILSVGSADLSLAYGLTENSDQSKLLRLKHSIYKRIISSGKMALDKAATFKEARKAYDMGIRCFYITSDSVLLIETLDRIISPIKSVF